jgi:hypothetical protein
MFRHSDLTALTEPAPESEVTRPIVLLARSIVPGMNDIPNDSDVRQHM